MKRSEKQFPYDDTPVFAFLKKIWTEGWLDEYSDDHFLIKIIEGRLSSFVGQKQLLENNISAIGAHYNTNYAQDKSFQETFLVHFSMKLNALYKRFGDGIKRFVTDQLSAGKDNYKEDAFFQALSEVSVLCSLAKHDWDKTEYEPPTNNKKNPEAAFSMENGIKVNVEVKTGQFDHKIKYNTFIPTILLTDKGREILKEKCKSIGLTYLPPKVKKLVDFINSAAQKFNTPTNKEYNLLYINWSYRDYENNSFLEAWSLMTNFYNGILTHSDIGKKFGLTEDVYKKISAIIVYSESLEGLMFNDFEFVFQRCGYGARFRLWLNKEIEGTNSNLKDDIFKITSMKPDPDENQYYMATIQTDMQEIMNREQLNIHNLIIEHALK